MLNMIQTSFNLNKLVLKSICDMVPSSFPTYPKSYKIVRNGST